MLIRFLRAGKKWLVGGARRFRGRLLEVPGLGTTLEIIEGTFRQFFEDDCHIMASAISFYAILSSIPFLLLLSSIGGFVLSSLSPDPIHQEELYVQIEQSVKAVVPFAGEDFLAHLREIVGGRKTLGFTGLVVLVITAWLVFSTLEMAFGRIFRTRRRPMVISHLFFIAMVLGIGLLLLLLHFSGVVVRSLLPEGTAPWQIELQDLLARYASMRFGFTFLLAGVSFVLLLTYFSHKKIRSRSTWFGGIVFAGLWMLAIQAFGYYLGHFARLSLLYGSLATLVTLVIWMYYCSLILLACAELTSVLQARRDKNAECVGQAPSPTPVTKT